MIQTLRITGVAAVAFAGVVLASVLGPVSLIRYGGTGDQRVERVLAAPGAVDRFQEMHGDKGPDPDTTPPLVKQAGIFKEIIDPRQPVAAAPAASRSAATRVAPAIRPPVTSAKFTLIGTCYSPSNPKDSFAYIRMDSDKTFKWVRCGDEVGGYLTIKEVKENSVVCWDGRNTQEIQREVPPDRVSLLETDGPEQTSAATATPQPAEVRTAGQPANLRRPVVPKMGAEDRKAVRDIVDKIKMLNGSSGPAGSATSEERVAAISKLMSELKSSRVSPQETRRLEDLGGEPNDNHRAMDEKTQRFIKKLNADRASRN